MPGVNPQTGQWDPTYNASASGGAAAFRTPQQQLQEQTAYRTWQGENDPEQIWKDQFAHYGKNLPGNKPRPEYQGFTGADGALDPNYSLNARPDVAFNSNIAGLDSRLAGINVNQQGIEAYRNRALQTGSSPWATMMLEKQGVEQAQRGDEMTRGMNAGRSAAYSGLGQRGGASAGARERIASKGMMAEQLARQELARGGQAERLGIGVQDEATKMDFLKGLPGAEVAMLQPELQKAGLWSQMATNENQLKTNTALANRDYATGVDRTNLGTRIQDRTNRNQFSQDTWKNEQDAWKAWMQSGAERWA